MKIVDELEQENYFRCEHLKDFKSFPAVDCDFESDDYSKIISHCQIVHYVKSPKPGINFSILSKKKTRQQLVNTEKSMTILPNADKDSQIRNHNAVGNMPVKYQCSKCPSKFADEDSLAKHKLSIHKYSMLISCAICDLHFPNEFSVKQHVKYDHQLSDIKSGYKVVASAIENKNVTKEPCSDDNVKETSLSNKKKQFFNCHLCDFESDCSSELVTHTTTVHESVKQSSSEQLVETNIDDIEIMFVDDTNQTETLALPEVPPTNPDLHFFLGANNNSSRKQLENTKNDVFKPDSRFCEAADNDLSKQLTMEAVEANPVGDNENSTTVHEGAKSNSLEVLESGTSEKPCQICQNNDKLNCFECGCMKCGGKTPENRLLFCESCQYFLHFQCLPNPINSLDELPGGPNADFYCPDCRNDSLFKKYVGTLPSEEGKGLDIDGNPESKKRKINSPQNAEMSTIFKSSVDDCSQAKKSRFQTIETEEINSSNKKTLSELIEEPKKVHENAKSSWCKCNICGIESSDLNWFAKHINEHKENKEDKEVEKPKKVHESAKPNWCNIYLPEAAKQIQGILEFKLYIVQHWDH